ncbi:hypothetical protein M2459_001697 [Parabacteroides sp. PF5-5]|nr:hypothetical protein [Parabacteroides sp. PH5-39]MDH6315954.1 hypothetical protein [Parabacteroides sp. PF5-13]MDH6319611.1 hypothetical protein [Parabacteroides sp. PH5-13]MDH6323342.1 hypothetical protein [Parabacteroides sp. PH5-8]MDH6327149.1 hypothetical protein [Parabacteroides sp. PH5-41]MDH6334951.1 hypothetical protein [Parabacteroides sp. PF5-5]MDH6346015.1 hypothetical protein [Parabacteroides sp. PH5-46]MDH6360967.1 hypothetical protein [Parabacteroides sp. PH5-16]MDH6376634.
MQKRLSKFEMDHDFVTKKLSHIFSMLLNVFAGGGGEVFFVGGAEVFGVGEAY